MGVITALRVAAGYGCQHDLDVSRLQARVSAGYGCPGVNRLRVAAGSTDVLRLRVPTKYRRQLAEHSTRIQITGTSETFSGSVLWFCMIMFTMLQNTQYFVYTNTYNATVTYNSNAGVSVRTGSPVP